MKRGELMATGNDKVSALKVASKIGMTISIRDAKPNDTMTVSVLKDGKEIAFFMDKELGRDKSVIYGSSLDDLVKYIQDNFEEEVR